MAPLQNEGRASSAAEDDEDRWVRLDARELALETRESALALQETRLTQRERMTALREALADARDREADDRECAADARERADDAWEDAAGPRDAGRLERVRRASAARSVANWRREQAAVDREAALTSIEALRVRYDC